MAARYAFVPFAFSNAIPRVSASLSSPLLCSARLLATPRLVATTPSLFFAPFLYPRLIDAGLENQDGRPITLSISRSPVYLRGNILPKNKYLRRARPLAFRFFIHHPPLHPSRRRMTSLPWIELSFLFEEGSSSRRGI